MKVQLEWSLFFLLIELLECINRININFTALTFGYPISYILI